MSTPIQLSDAYLINITNNPDVRKRFGGLAEMAKVATASGCGSCGAQNQTKSNALQQVRMYIMNMPDSDLQELKRLLNVSSRTFASYVPIGGGRSRKVER